jgi:two-component system nitrate/nitrite response regulator NarL
LTLSARVLIADFGVTRLGVRMALEDQDVEVCAESDDARQAILDAKQTQPDFCLVGWDLPGGGVTAIEGIVDAAPDSAVVVLAAARNVDQLLAAVRAGAIGYVPGSATAEQLHRVVQAVIAREAIVPRSMVRGLIAEIHSAAALVAGKVSAREGEVLKLLRRGHSTAEIAQLLDISPVTVRRHMSDLMRKLGADSRADLLRLGGGTAGANPGARPDEPTHRRHTKPRR